MQKLIKRRNMMAFISLAVLIGVFIVFNLYIKDFPSFENDEAWYTNAIYFQGNSNEECFTGTFILYEGFLKHAKIFSNYFGFSIESLRTMSFIFAVLSLIIIFFIGYIFINIRTGFGAAFLLGCYPGFIKAAHFIRPDMAACFYTLLAFLLLLKALQTDKIVYIIISSFIFGFLLSIHLYTSVNLLAAFFIIMYCRKYRIGNWMYFIIGLLLSFILITTLINVDEIMNYFAYNKSQVGDAADLIRIDSIFNLRILIRNMFFEFMRPFNYLTYQFGAYRNFFISSKLNEFMYIIYFIFAAFLWEKSKQYSIIIKIHVFVVFCASALIILNHLSRTYLLFLYLPFLILSAVSGLVSFYDRIHMQKNEHCKTKVSHTYIAVLIGLILCYGIIKNYIVEADILFLLCIIAILLYIHVNLLCYKIVIYILLLTLLFGVFMDTFLESFYYSLAMQIHYKYILLLLIPFLGEYIKKNDLINKTNNIKQYIVIAIVFILMAESISQLKIIQILNYNKYNIKEYYRTIDLIKQNIESNSVVYGPCIYWPGMKDYCHYRDIQITNTKWGQKYIFTKDANSKNIDYLIIRHSIFINDPAKSAGDQDNDHMLKLYVEKLFNVNFKKMNRVGGKIIFKRQI